MTLFSLHHAGMRGRSGFTVAPLLWRLRRLLRTIHRGIVAAKMRRLRSELIFRSSHRDDWAKPYPEGRRGQAGDAGFPHQPQVLSEKWDY